ncbi:MAG: GSCFA domain-containing protein [Rhodobacteraceae bacterium]|nr:GSCFA domain-containing protein [Paracoccaceae bacterium]
MAEKKTKAAKAASDPSNPYLDVPENGFWKSAVASRAAFEINGLWTPKFKVVPKHRIVTAGSCFAQHIGKALSARGYGWYDAEPAPAGLSDESRKKFNYGIFSFRTGNIYTAKALRQWVEWAFGVIKAPTEIWEKDGRFYDPFRPAIEPDGFASKKEAMQSREAVFAAIRRAVEKADFFVFTMGLTESWYNAEHGYEYAMCPGTVAGEFDPDKHKFRNQNFAGIKADVKGAIAVMRKHNKKLRILLTISPVPLTATASGQHVLTATVHSKSTLRAVAGDLAANHRLVDYFPSYEIITSAPYRAMFFAPNMRSVTPQGVAHVMDSFFHDQGAEFGPVKQSRVKKSAKSLPTPKKQTDEDLVCEEEMLNAFAS